MELIKNLNKITGADIRTIKDSVTMDDRDVITELVNRLHCEDKKQLYACLFKMGMIVGGRDSYM